MEKSLQGETSSSSLSSVHPRRRRGEPRAHFPRAMKKSKRVITGLPSTRACAAFTEMQVSEPFGVVPWLFILVLPLADLYHVRCFEKLVDFSQSNYLGRINPVTRNTVRLRGVKGTSVLDGNYLVDGGAERLILEWKVSMGRLIDKRDGVPIEPLEPEFNDLLRKSGSASYQPRKVKGMTDIEFINLAHNLAPIESDGDGDQEEWNLFEQYLPLTFDDSEDLNEPHSLSSMLCAWKSHCVGHPAVSATERYKPC